MMMMMSVYHCFQYTESWVYLFNCQTISIFVFLQSYRNCLILCISTQRQPLKTALTCNVVLVRRVASCLLLASSETLRRCSWLYSRFLNLRLQILPSDTEKKIWQQCFVLPFTLELAALYAVPETGQTLRFETGTSRVHRKRGIRYIALSANFGREIWVDLSTLTDPYLRFDLVSLRYSVLVSACSVLVWSCSYNVAK
jgi:hypothetical protein